MKTKAFFILCVFLIAFVLITNRTTFCGATPSGTPANSGEYYYYEDVVEAKYIHEITEDIMLIAFDDYDGDLTEDIIVYDLDDYDINTVDVYPEQRLLGTYRLKYVVRDKSGNTAELMVYVVVLDTKDPIILDESVTYYEQDIDNITLTNDEILDNIIGYDEYCQYNLSKEIPFGGVESLSRVKDTPQEIVVLVKDGSLNMEAAIVEVVLRDYTKPTITTSGDTITTSYYAGASLQSLLDTVNVTVTDNYDTNLTYSVTENHYTANQSIVGNFTVKLSATDSSGNTGTKSLTIHIIDDIPPVFYLDISKVYVNVDFKLKEKDFIRLLKDSGKIQEPYYTFTVTEDEYSASYNEEGKYNYFCRLSYPSGKEENFQFQVNVLPKTVEEQPRIRNLFFAVKKIGLFIWKILKWPIMKLKQLL